MLVTCNNDHNVIVYEALSYSDPCPLCGALEGVDTGGECTECDTVYELERKIRNLEEDNPKFTALEEERDKLQDEIEQLKQLLRGVTCQG